MLNYWSVPDNISSYPEDILARAEHQSRESLRWGKLGMSCFCFGSASPKAGVLSASVQIFWRQKMCLQTAGFMSPIFTFFGCFVKRCPRQQHRQNFAEKRENTVTGCCLWDAHSIFHAFRGWWIFCRGNRTQNSFAAPKSVTSSGWGSPHWVTLKQNLHLTPEQGTHQVLINCNECVALQGSVTKPFKHVPVSWKGKLTRCHPPDVQFMEHLVRQWGKRQREEREGEHEVVAVFINTVPHQLPSGVVPWMLWAHRQMDSASTVIKLQGPGRGRAKPLTALTLLPAGGPESCVWESW